MTQPVVTFTYLTMGKLFLRSLTAEQRAGMAGSISQIPVSHWTLRVPSGTLIIDVHPDIEAAEQSLETSAAMFRDPVYRFRVEMMSFVDEHNAAATLAVLDQARAALTDFTPAYDPGAPGLLHGRLMSFNRLPQLPPTTRKAVVDELADHAFGSLVHLVLDTPSGPLLIDPYLAEDALMDDYVFVREVLNRHSYDVTNEWYAFVDRAHERALDHLAYGLGAIAAPTS
jgi:hypothetical protein